MSWHKKRIVSLLQHHLQIFEVYIFHVEGKLLLFLEVGHSNQSLMKPQVLIAVNNKPLLVSSCVGRPPA